MSAQPPTDTEETHDISDRARATGAVIWSSFLAAALATMVCFAFIDPLALAQGEPPRWWNTRLNVYAVGFFFFWLVGFVAATLSWFLARRNGAER